MTKDEVFQIRMTSDLKDSFFNACYSMNAKPAEVLRQHAELVAAAYEAGRRPLADSQEDDAE